MDAPLFLKVNSGYFVEVTNFGVRKWINLAQVREIHEVKNTCLTVCFGDNHDIQLSEFASQQLRIHLANLANIDLPNAVESGDY